MRLEQLDRPERSNQTSERPTVRARATQVTHADGFSETWTYNTSGLFSSHTDKMGVTGSATYDTYKRGVLTSDTDAVGTGVERSNLLTLDDAGRVTAERNAADVTTSESLDPVGRTLLTTDARGGAVRNVYDLAGQLVRSRDEMTSLLAFLRERLALEA